MTCLDVASMPLNPTICAHRPSDGAFVKDEGQTVPMTQISVYELVGPPVVE